MRDRRGSSLAELIATVGLATVLGATAAGGVVDVLESTRVAGTARHLAAALRAARGRALAGDGPVDVRFDASARRWEVRDGGGALVGTRTLPARVGFASLPARARVRFTRIGTADNATVTVAAGGHARQVVVNQRGRVRVQ
jgi:Tfp pilus assembly protein FimT